ncbi:hypothetical protein LC612_14525 [Nostoc sp. CHAB 5834]|nr:hypothetical protein [Nostoc sp. CHAB 5834]
MIEQLPKFPLLAPIHPTVMQRQKPIYLPKKSRAVSFFKSLLKSWGQGKEEFFSCLPLNLCLFSSL